MTNTRQFRRAMTDARKKRIWTREGGLCKRCGLPVPQKGAGVVYDHYSQIAISCDDSDENVFPLHAGKDSCNQAKTHEDATIRAKVERQRLKFLGEYPASPNPLKSAGFPKRWSGFR